MPASWLRYRIGRPAAIDPAHVQDAAGRIVVSQLFDPLVRFDYATCALVPCVAASYTVADDAQSITFTLVEGAAFHNGEAVTSSSFKRAWERLVRAEGAAGSAESGEGAVSDASTVQDGAAHSPSATLLELVAGYDALYAGTASELVGLRCPDDLTLAVELTEPCAEWVYLAAHPALAPVPASAEDDPEAFAARPVGNGAFKMEREWDLKGDIHLVANSERVLGAPSIEGALFAVEADTSAAYKQFLAGNLDVCSVPVDQFADAEAAGFAEDGRTLGTNARALCSDEPVLTYLVCNTMASPLNTMAFRQGLSCAIDRESLCEKTLKGAAMPADGPVPSCIAPDELAPWQACTYDPDRAQQLLSAVIPADETGERPEVVIELLYRKGGVHKRIAEQLAKDASAVGVTLKPRALDAAELARRYQEGDFVCGLATWAPASLAPGAFLYDLLHSTASVERGNTDGDAASDGGTREDAGDGASAQESVTARADVAAQGDTAAQGDISEGSASRADGSAYANTEVDAQLDAARAAVDEATSIAAYAQALALAGEDMPIIPLIYPVHTVIASERVVSLAVEPDGIPALDSARM